MQVTTNNYNVLGKVGPHYERPEYRPPEQSPDNTAGQASELARPKSDRSTLSTKNTEAAPKKEAAAALPRLNLDGARALVASTSVMIEQLSPQSTQSPHLRLPSGLMRPTYA